MRLIDPIELKRSIAFSSMVHDGKTLEQIIDEQPSVEPEIIRCKDCKWWTKQANSLQGRCALYGMYPTGEWYCGNARRRTDTED